MAVTQSNKSREFSEAAACADAVDALEARLAEAEEDKRESDLIALGYFDALGKVQTALDMRCVDDPTKVGCNDTIYDCHEVAAAMRAQLADADELVRLEDYRTAEWARSRPLAIYLARYPKPITKETP